MRPKRASWLLPLGLVLAAGCGVSPDGSLLQGTTGGDLDAASHHLTTAPYVPANPLAPLPATSLPGEGSDVGHLAWISQGAFLRSAQPTPRGFAILQAKYHLGAVVNFRLEDDSEAAPVKALGLDYLYLPMPDGHSPAPDQVKQFFDWVYAERAAHKVVLIHCHAGIGRTGLFDILLRLASGWTTRNAIFDDIRYGPLAPNQYNAVNAFAQVIGDGTFYPIPLVSRTPPYTYPDAQTYVWGPGGGPASGSLAANPAP